MEIYISLITFQHHAPLDPNSKIEICEYRNKKKNSKRCAIPISKESAEKSIMLCNYHRRKMQDQATSIYLNNLFFLNLILIFLIIRG